VCGATVYSKKVFRKEPEEKKRILSTKLNKFLKTLQKLNKPLETHLKSLEKLQHSFSSFDSTKSEFNTYHSQSLTNQQHNLVTTDTTEERYICRKTNRKIYQATATKTEK